MGFTLTARDRERLTGVHADLVRVVSLAAAQSAIPFMVIEGVRTLETQQQYFAAKKTKTMDSRHLTGHAVDLAPLVNGAIPWGDKAAFKRIHDAMEAAAASLGIPLRWGGDWNGNGSSADESFYDGPHFELPKARYPA